MPVYEKDIVLIYFEDEPTGFARIEEISPDVKKNWYHVRLLLLNLPLQTVSWILRDVYIDGEEFTMGGHRMRLEKVEAPKDEFFDFDSDLDDEDFDDDKYDDDDGSHEAKSSPTTIVSRPAAEDDRDKKQNGKIISFNDFKNRKK